MTTLLQSSKARDRILGEWYEQIRTGQLRLPRFQRFEAWDRGRITGFLNTIIQNLPVGVTLLLEVGDAPKFQSRFVTTAPETGHRETEHVLDGQQRLTAFWRAMHNNYEGETYFIYLLDFDDTWAEYVEDGEEGDDSTPKIHMQPRWEHKGQRRPVWADIPKRCFQRGCVPIDLLCPGDQAQRIDAWIKSATKHLEPADRTGSGAFEQFEAATKRREELNAIIQTMRERVTHFNLPYLALPASTDADVALQVFVNMNTNSKPLSMFDLTVAKVEQEVSTSLHDLIEHLEAEYPQVSNYGDMSRLMMQTAALLQGQIPNNSGIAQMDKRVLVDDWPRLERAMVRAADFLARQNVHDDQRLPTRILIPVLAACTGDLPDDGDKLGQAERLLRAYVWSAFFCNRYEGAVNTRAVADYKALSRILTQDSIAASDYPTVPMLNRADYPLPTHEQLMRVGWPKGQDRLARAVQAACLYFGGRDFADDRPVSYDSLKNREYHHLFPDALLSDAGIQSYLALNCALVTWKTNRNIGRKDPLDYLQDRVIWSTKDDVRSRLRTHLIDYEAFSSAHYVDAGGEPLKDEALSAKLVPEFGAFLSQRARAVALLAEKLARGEQPTLDAVWTEARGLPAEVTDEDDEAREDALG